MLFLELSRFFDNLADVGNLISGSSAFSKTSLNIWKFTVHVFLKPGLENFEQYSTSVWDECSCAVVWTFIGIAFLWDWNEHWPFPILWPLQSFPDLLAYWAYCLIANLFSVLNKYSLVWCFLVVKYRLCIFAVATGLEKVSFHSNPKERQCQRMLQLPHNCTHLTC